MESDKCNRRGSDAQQPAWSSYGIKCEVKVEPEWGECGVSAAAATAGLYAGTDVKDELVIGPELIQQQAIQFSTKCETCKTTFDCKSSLSHYNLINSENDSYTDKKCCNCKRISPSPTPQHVYSDGTPVSSRSCLEKLEAYLKSHRPIEKRKKSDRSLCCNQRFDQKSLLTDHVQMDEKKYICNSCKKEFTDKTALAIHIRIHAREELYNCNKCNKQFIVEAEYTNHLQTHTVKKVRTTQRFFAREADYRMEGDVFVCTRCDARYEIFSTLRHHLKVKHYKIPLYHCNHCSKGFITEPSFINHKLEEHKIDDRFKCNVSDCNAILRSKVSLRKHTTAYHTVQSKTKCDQCNYEGYPQNMNKHKLTHRTGRNHQCSYCKKSFRRKSTLRQHEKIHMGERDKVCSVCGQAFVQKASLNYHMMKHHPDVKFQGIQRKI